MSRNKRETTQSQTRLFEWLDREMSERKMNKTDLAQWLQISRPYLYALQSGARDVRNMDRELIERIAAFTRRPVVSIYIAAGILDMSDFAHTGEAAFDSECDRAMAFIKADPNWGVLCPCTDGLEQETKLFVINAYEAATGRTLMSHHAAPPAAIAPPKD